MMFTELNRGTRKGRKTHRCYDCGRIIPVGQSHDFATYKCDDVYTLRWHSDCRAACDFYMKSQGLTFYDFFDGIPPISEMFNDSGDFDVCVASIRGYFPHVATRLELNQQQSFLKYIERLRNDGHSEDYIQSVREE